MVLVFFKKGMLEKATPQRIQQFSAFACDRQNHFKCSHAHLLEKLRLIAIAETYLFLTIQSLTIPRNFATKK